jgi:hypothetical protein
MQECRPIKVPIHVGVKLYVDQCLKTHKRKRTCPMFHMLVWLAD